MFDPTGLLSLTLTLLPRELQDGNWWRGEGGEAAKRLGVKKKNVRI